MDGCALTVAAPQLEGDGVFDADEAEAERVKAKAKLEKVCGAPLPDLISHAFYRPAVRALMCRVSRR